MGKSLKIVLGLVVALVVLLVAAAVVLPMVVDPNDYKDEIAAAVEKQTGRSLQIEGDIDLSVFPWLGLDIGATRLSNAVGFDEPYMASMESVQLRVKLLPLLHQQLEVDKIRLAGLQLNLGKDRNGVANWADLQGAAAPETADKAGDRGGKDAGGKLERLAIGGIEVRDARLVWDDRSADAHYEIDALAFTTGEIAPDEPFDLDLAFNLAATQPAISAQFSLRGGVLLAADLSAVDITAARLQLDASGDGVPGGELLLSLASDVAVDLGAQTLSLPELVLETLGMKLSGQVSGTAIAGDDPRFTGTLSVAGFAPRDVIKALGQEIPATADAGVLAKSDASLQWEASGKHFAATTLQLHLDETTVDGTARVDSFAAPAISFDLAIDTFDLDRYLPPAAAGAEPAAGSPAGQADGATAAKPMQLDALRSLNLNGRLHIGSLKAFNLNTRDVEIQVKGKDGLLRLNPLGAKLYNGSYSGDITLDARKDIPHFSVNENLSSVQAGPLLKDLTGDDRLLGTASVQAQLSAAGATPEALRSSLNGTTAFSFTDGTVKGVNIAALIRTAQAKLKGQPAPEGNLPNQTDFAMMKGTAKVTNGLVSNDDLAIQSPLLRISGKGEVGLPQETIDYTLTTKIVGTLEGQGGKALEELKGVAIPVHVGGTFSRPTYAPDLGAALSEAAKAKVEEKVEEQKQKLQQKLGDELQDKLLKGLFK